MFDDLRKQAEQGSEEENPDEFVVEERPRQPTSARIFGMTAPQRLVIVAMLLVWVCEMSFFILFLTEKIMPF